MRATGFGICISLSLLAACDDSFNVRQRAGAVGYDTADEETEGTEVGEIVDHSESVEADSGDTGVFLPEEGDTAASGDTAVPEPDGTEEEKPTEYKGGWAIGACADDIVSTGTGIGDVAEDFELTDQYGESVRLHAFCDRAVLVVACTMWSTTCAGAAGSLETWYEGYETDGFVVLELMSENKTGDAPSAEDLAEWADATGSAFPILSDPGGKVSRLYEKDGSIPSMTLIVAGTEIVSVDSAVATDDIEDILY